MNNPKQMKKQIIFLPGLVRNLISQFANCGTLYYKGDNLLVRPTENKTKRLVLSALRDSFDRYGSNKIYTTKGVCELYTKFTGRSCKTQYMIKHLKHLEGQGTIENVCIEKNITTYPNNLELSNKEEISKFGKIQYYWRFQDESNISIYTPKRMFGNDFDIINKINQLNKIRKKKKIKPFNGVLCLSFQERIDKSNIYCGNMSAYKKINNIIFRRLLKMGEEFEVQQIERMKNYPTLVSKGTNWAHVLEVGLQKNYTRFTLSDMRDFIDNSLRELFEERFFVLGERTNLSGCMYVDNHCIRRYIKV